MNSILSYLKDDLRNTGNASNTAESDVIKQMLLINSGALGVLGVSIANSNELPIHMMVLLTIAVSLLSLSLVVNISHLLTTFLFFRRIAYSLGTIIENMTGKDTAEEIAKKVNALVGESRAGATLFTISVVLFAVSALLIVTIIIFSIWQ